MVSFQFPDGKTYKFPEGTSKETAIKYYKQKVAPELDFTPTTGDYARAAAQGLTFGFADEIEAAVRSAFSDKTYEQEVGEIRKGIETFREEAPAKALATEIGASALLPFGAARAATQLGGRAAQLARAAGQTAAARPASTAAASGALYGAGAAEDISDVPESALAGGLLGGAIGGAVSKALPRISQEAKQFIERGVPLTPGQAMGGLPRAFESTARALPFAGGAIEKAQARSVAEFSRTSVEDALKPLGLELKKGITGTTAVKQAFDKIDEVYKEITPRLKIDDAAALRDATVKSVEDSIEKIGLITKGQQKEVNKYLKDIAELFSGDEITGKTFVKADKIINKKVYQLTKFGQSAENMEIGEILKSVQKGIRDELERQNPAAAADYKKIRQSYERLMPVQAATAKSRAAREAGEFSPSELLQSAISQRRRAGARGEAPMQAEALIGERIMGADRTGIARPLLEARPLIGLLGGAGAVGTGSIVPALAGIGGLSAAYSRAGVPLTRNLLTGLGETLRAPIPVASGLLGAKFSGD